MSIVKKLKPLEGAGYCLGMAAAFRFDALQRARHTEDTNLRRLLVDEARHHHRHMLSSLRQLHQIRQWSHS